MKITKNQLRRIIKEERKKMINEMESSSASSQTLYQVGLSIISSHFEELSDVESGDADYLYEKMMADHTDRMAEELCDWWVDSSGMFGDYTGDEDAMWEALRDAAELVIQEAAGNFFWDK